MAAKSIFIASSGKAQPLADALLAQLSNIKTPFKEVIPWWTQSSVVQDAGTTLLAGLCEECERVDMAVVLLTQDDVFLRNGEQARKPRDNCIFELGLFIGGLGLDPRRCVIVTSVPADDLPDDIRELQRISFPAPSAQQLNDERWCNQEMGKVVAKLTQHAKSLKEGPHRPLFSVLSEGELIERERPQAEGGDLVVGGGHRAVVVNTVQPAEDRIEIAKQVVANIDKGIEYIYFFRASTERSYVVVNLLQSLVLAKLAHGEPCDAERRELIAASGGAVLERLKTLRNYVWIHFLPDDRVPVLCCVHNAREANKARCYLKYSRDNEDYFVLWYEGDRASNVAADLCNLRVRQTEPGIFFSTTYFDLYSSENPGKALREALRERIREYFTEALAPQVSELCFVK